MVEVNSGPSSPPVVGAVAPAPYYPNPAAPLPPGSPYPVGVPPPVGYAAAPYGQPPQPVMMIPTVAPLPVVVPVIGSVNGQDPLLEGLLAFPSLLLKQQVQDVCVEMYCRWAHSNKYNIYNPNLGQGWYQQQILHVEEDSECCARFCCHARRGMNLRVLTADDREVIMIDRPFHLYTKGGCFCYCSDLFYQIIDVYSGKDTQFGHAKLGRVRQNFSFFKPYLSILNAEGDEVYRVLASCIDCGRRSFRIFRAHEHDMEKRNQIGKIRKKWGGFTQEFLTNCDNFSIRFPVDANHVQRALIIATSLFIDYLYYEHSQTPAQEMSNNF
eukprot:TRINITY_DN468_c0_g2_i1.p1 TRINITY_DN468_c0_g2~~TRINITY_DN468_c0_g2_i1.p1  ORF type:complete len:372 (-),score=69.33 TRINITY_DN468_c0_g2_i1:189-1166(-)